MKSHLKHNVSKLQGMPKYLKSRIFGQDHVIDSMMDMMSINLAGIGEENKPIASFLFTGSTGVGKTELVIEMAKYLDMHFQRFDMSEYSDESSAQNLIGGNKGLVGYEEGGLLTNAIAASPHSVLLLDEIEKSDQSIYNTFLQIFDYATLTDTKGNSVDFSNTIIIMTSNLGATQKRSMGFGEKTDTMHDGSAIKHFFTPEFRNRIDKVLQFNPLTRDMIEPVVKKFLLELSYKLFKKHIKFSITNNAKKHLADTGFESAMGARSVKRTINNEFKKHISHEILFGKLSHGGRVKISLKDKNFVYHYESLDEAVDLPKSNLKQLDELCDYDFKTAEEAQEYAKRHVGTVISRANCGVGYRIVS